MSCKFCASPFDECDCWIGKLRSDERILLQEAALAKWEIKREAEKVRPVIIRRGHFGNKRAKKRIA
jgi:hypothetical protein